MLSLSKFSTFNSARIFPALGPVGNNFTLQLSGQSGFISAANERIFLLDSVNKIIKSGTAWNSLTSTSLSFSPKSVAYRTAYPPGEYLLTGDNNGIAQFASGNNGTTWTDLVYSTTYGPANLGDLVYSSPYFFTLCSPSTQGDPFGVFSGNFAGALTQFTTDLPLYGGSNFPLFCWINQLAFNGNTAVAILTEGYNSFFYSTTMSNPSTWVLRYTSYSPNYYFNIVYGNGIFIANSYSDLLISSDGINWTSYPTGFMQIAFYKGTFYGFNIQTCSTSTNGINWTSYSNVINEPVTSIAVTKSMISVLTDAGRIYSSP